MNSRSRRAFVLPPDLDRGLREAEVMITNARGVLARGEPLDLTPIGHHIADLLEGLEPHLKALQESDQDAQQVRAKVESMIRELDGIERDLLARATAETPSAGNS